jgi:poly(hydroxyalkanoate) depolymerase family esterase
MKIDMAEVTRLTREGRIEHAMRLLRALHDTPARAAAAASASARHEPDSHVRLDVIDLQPPSAQNGGAWTEAPPDAAAAQPQGPPASGERRGVRPGALSSTLDRALKPRIRLRPAPSSPVVDVPPGARYEERVHSGAGGTLGYMLYVPGGHDATARPLVVMLHGCTQSPDDFARGTRMNELAEEQGFLVAYPAQSQSANPSKCWNWFNAADQHRDGGEPALIAGITRDVLCSFDVDPRRVYVAGLSAGGAMAAIMGAAYPDVYAAVGVHSGLVPGAARDLPSAFAAMRNGSASSGEYADGARGAPTIIFHGDADATVHPLNADRLAARARGAVRVNRHVSAGASADGMTYTRCIDSDADGRPLLEQWVLHGAGHAWSGGDPDGSYVEPRGPDASRAMLRFFAEHANTRRKR